MKSQNQDKLSAERWQKTKAIVAEALEQLTASRSEFVRARCGDDAELLSEVESLLEQTTGSLESFAQSTTESLSRQMSILAPGQRVGAYRILRELGRGGMGAVYLAERADGAFEKQFAIKVLKRGTDTDEVLRRFSSERQILARLNHPNIAGLVDAGTTDDGLPYFVMECVIGKPITKYAEEQKFSIKERLGLFRTVCSAVSYAHQRLVIHRDLKPSNVLVTNDGEIKLLDFGIAKLVDESAPEMTVTQQRRMTPEYASPEQVKGEPVTTVSDVYSLGVLLYELLTGSRPYKLKTRSPDEITKAIREQEPTKPSTAVAKSDGNSKSQTPNPKILRGDLDNIVLKALRKEPERRYVSVDQFSADIRRYLEGLPVRARKDTAGYRAGKFVKRHKIGVVVFALMVSILAAGIIATTIEARRANRRFNEVRKIANSLMLELHNSIKDLPGAMAARQLIIRRAVEYLDSLAQEAGDDLSLKSELATAYEKIGLVTFDVGPAVRAHRKAVALSESLVRADPKNEDYQKQLSESYSDLSDVMKISGNSTESVDYAKKSLAIVQSLAADKASDKNIETALADRHLSLGIALRDAGYAREAITNDVKAMEIERNLLVENSSDQEISHRLAGIYGELSDAYEDTADHSAALNYARQQMQIAQVLFQTDPSNARYRRDMWSAEFHTGKELASTGDTNGALDNYAKATELIEGLSSADPNDKGHRRWLASTYLSDGDLFATMTQPEKALQYYRKAIGISEQLLAEDAERVEARRDLTKMYESQGILLAKMGQKTSAMKNLKKAEALCEQSTGADPHNARIREQLSRIRAVINRSE